MPPPMRNSAVYGDGGENSLLLVKLFTSILVTHSRAQPDPRFL